MPHSGPGEPPGGYEQRARILIGILVAGYVLGVVALASAGRFTFVWKTSVVPLIVVAAFLVRRLKAFLRDWSVFLGIIILFDSLRGLVFAAITRFDLPVYAGYAIRADQALLGGWTLPNLLQKLLAHDGTAGTFEKTLVIVHGSHFFAFLVFGLAIWLLRADHFRRFATSIAWLLALGIIIYAAAPTVPPWMASTTFHLIPPLHHVTTSVYNTITPTLSHTFDVNPIAAMPSLHAALPILCAFIAWHHFGRAGLVVATYACSVCFAIGYLGEHYYIDILAGACLALVVYLATYRLDVGGVLRRGVARPVEDRNATLRAAIGGLLLVVTAEAVGQASASIRRDFTATEPFVRRELVGKSDLAELSLAQLSLARGDRPRALEHLRAATAELRNIEHRAAATRMLETLEGTSHGSKRPPLGP